jgi:trans-2,3-dihydro-3-hydroxyanthranilate isomerase
MKKIQIFQADAFTSVPFHGNPAGVVLNAHGLRVKHMQSIAGEMNCSETAFLFPEPGDPNLFKIRYFTPTEEVPLCGHATIASFYVLTSQLFSPDIVEQVRSYSLKTGAGKLSVYSVIQRGKVKIWMQLPLPDFREVRLRTKQLAPILGCRDNDIRKDIPAVTNSDSLLIPVRSLRVLETLAPDSSRLNKYLRGSGLTGVSVFTTETFERRSAVHSRFFAPGIGILEDPVTGSLNGPLGAYLVRHGLVRVRGRKTELIGEQGDFIRRPGRVYISVEHSAERITRVLIGGEAVVTMEGYILL